MRYLIHNLEVDLDRASLGQPDLVWQGPRFVPSSCTRVAPLHSLQSLTHACNPERRLGLGSALDHVEGDLRWGMLLRGSQQLGGKARCKRHARPAASWGVGVERGCHQRLDHHRVRTPVLQPPAFAASVEGSICPISPPCSEPVRRDREVGVAGREDDLEVAVELRGVCVRLRGHRGDEHRVALPSLQPHRLPSSEVPRSSDARKGRARPHEARAEVARRDCRPSLRVRDVDDNVASAPRLKGERPADVRDHGCGCHHTEPHGVIPPRERLELLLAPVDVEAGSPLCLEVPSKRNRVVIHQQHAGIRCTFPSRPWKHIISDGRQGHVACVRENLVQHGLHPVEINIIEQAWEVWQFRWQPWKTWNLTCRPREDGE
mmetsp:Transcript_58190/g.136909  ORF Transcript_58190/g.136909 Transcript_58190/m.136909 type:complete len:375 (-) Transcript_58190:352-1476(-)